MALGLGMGIDIWGTGCIGTYGGGGAASPSLNFSIASNSMYLSLF